MKLRECRSCLPSEMKFSASNYSIHWFKNGIVASLARFRPKLLLKARSKRVKFIQNACIVGGGNFRATKMKRKRAMSPFTCRERVHRGKAERRTLMENADKKLQRRETTNEEMFGFNVSFRWVSMLEIFQRKFLVYLEFLRLRDGKRKINSVWKLFVKILWILWNSWEW